VELFAVICETCTARLKVRDMRAIGQILACPKCGGMVQIAPPTGWTPPSTETLAAHADDSVTSTGSTIQFKQPVSAQEALANASSKRREKAAAAAVAAAALTNATPAAASPTSGTFDAAEIANATPSESAAPAVEGAGAAIASRAAAVSRAAATIASSASGVAHSMAQNWIYWLCGPIAVIALVLVSWIVYQSTGSKTQVAAVDTSANPSSAPATAAAPLAQPGEPGANEDPANPNVAQAVPADPPDAAPADPVNDQQPATDQPVEPAGPAAADDMPDNDANAVPGADQARPVDELPPVPKKTPPNKVDAPEADEAMPDDPAPELDANGAATIPKEDNPEAGTTKVEKPVVEDRKQDDAEADAAEDPDAAQPTVSSPIDVDARLADPLERIEFRRIKLVDFCDFLSELSTIPITLDVDALATAGVAPDEPLQQIKKTATTVGELLKVVLAEHGLIYEVHGQQLLITVPPADLITVPYDVRELAGPDEAGGEKLVTLITRFVSPSTWQVAGGKGTIKFAEGKLTVEQTPSVQRRVTTFLERLRVARGFTPKVAAAAGAAPKTKYGRIKERLQKDKIQPVTGTYGIETPLDDVLQWLGKQFRTRILIDGVSLTQVDRTFRSPVKLIIEKQSLDEALISLLDPLDLTFRVVDENTVQVYARKPVGERYEFELHPIRELLDRSNLEKILSVIREKVEPKSWTGAGGAGVIEFDPASKSLLVLQSPEVQIKLEKLLDKSRAGAAPPARKAP
jgi:hypothetical protein